MQFLVDTNVLSELRKGARCDPNVALWANSHPTEDIFLSVLVLGEIRQGLERARRRDADKARALERWLDAVRHAFAGRVVPVDHAVADAWGRMNVPDPVPVIDGLIAATAKFHGLTLVTRNVGDLERRGVSVLNPFEFPAT